MLQRFVNFFGLVRSNTQGGEFGENSVLDGTSISLLDLSLKQKDKNVRIIHAGGLVELYNHPIPASIVMEKHPGMCLTRPEIFKSPHDSLLHPAERLFPGQKFYLVPCTTIQKLKRKHPEPSPMSQLKETRANKNREKKKLGDKEDEEEDNRCSAKDFFVAREKWQKCVLRRYGRVKKAFRPPIKNARRWRGLGWEPSLTSIKELCDSI
ncbi:hypothetical protein GIB67_030853 [Kingdonia uniflora]|uniref:Uncharacterized protein n=1 Tax=Kingdonia uniflora TaxID=39325 RepID=A0A7J7L3D7_9MAGN|nr:hypothetical protein GIB67_030853 [Kingdonia uniflora]